MYDQIRQDTLFIIFYSIVTAMAAMASCYLLFRRANAIAPDVTPPVRLRRWTAAFLAAFALNHIWYMPILFLSSSEDIRLCDLVGGLLDSMTVFPLMIIVLLTMLQDRHRPLWPVALMMAPVVVGSTLCVATLSYVFLPALYVYILLMCMGLIVYMVRALRQYSRWLRDNYADLEHKEVWQSFVFLAIVLLVFVVYAFIYEGLVYLYAMQAVNAMLICYLLWRVETLSDLSIPVYDSEDLNATPHADQWSENVPDKRGCGISPGEKISLSSNIGLLLRQRCEEPQLYLQYDLSLPQLAQAIGTNRSYLSQYFSNQGTTYNAYINNLRINHFVSLYREAVASRRSFTAQQLARESGYHSYSTFCCIVKRKTGQSVTAWMKTLLERGGEP